MRISGADIKAFRKAKRLKQKDFADSIGVHQTKVSAWERDVYAPTAADEEKIIAEYGDFFEIIAGPKQENPAGTLITAIQQLSSGEVLKVLNRISGQFDEVLARLDAISEKIK